jgi:hypothetical protein
VFTTTFNVETTRQRQAAAEAAHRRPRTEHLIESRSHPPSRHRLSPRRPIALVLVRIARRVDGETARRAIA